MLEPGDVVTADFPGVTIATSFVDGLAAVLAPKSGHVILEGRDTMLDVTERDGSGYIDVTGQLKISLPLATTLRTFQRGLAWVESPRVEDRGGTGYIDRNGNWVWRYDPAIDKASSKTD